MDLMTNRHIMAVVLVAACGSDPSEGQEPDAGVELDATGSGSTSGSRIKARMLVTPDGAKQHQGWHDAERDEDCSFVPTSDGSTRCLPTNRALHLVAYYADTLCTVPVVPVIACEQAPSYIVGATTVSCGGADTVTYGPVYQRGAAITTAYQKSGASCTAVAYDGYVAGPMVQLTEFQSATVAIE